MTTFLDKIEILYNHQHQQPHQSYSHRAVHTHKIWKWEFTRKRIFNSWYVNIKQDTNVWQILFTNGPDYHNRAFGSSAYAIDVNKKTGERHTVSGPMPLTGVWKSSISMWPVNEEEGASEIYNHLVKVVEETYEQNKGLWRA